MCFEGGRYCYCYTVLYSSPGEAKGEKEKGHAQDPKDAEKKKDEKGSKKDSTG